MTLNKLRDLFRAADWLTTNRHNLIARLKPCLSCRSIRLHFPHNYGNVAVVRNEIEKPLSRRLQCAAVGVIVSGTRCPLRSTTSGKAWPGDSKRIAANGVPLRIFIAVKRNNAIAGLQSRNLGSTAARQRIDDRSWSRRHAVHQRSGERNRQRGQDIHYRPGKRDQNSLPTRTQIESFVLGNV